MMSENLLIPTDIKCCECGPSMEAIEAWFCAAVVSYVFLLYLHVYILMRCFLIDVCILRCRFFAGRLGVGKRHPVSGYHKLIPVPHANYRSLTAQLIQCGMSPCLCVGSSPRTHVIMRIIGRRSHPYDGNLTSCL